MRFDQFIVHLVAELSMSGRIDRASAVWTNKTALEKIGHYPMPYIPCIGSEFSEALYGLPGANIGTIHSVPDQTSVDGQGYSYHIYPQTANYTASKAVFITMETKDYEASVYHQVVEESCQKSLDRRRYFPSEEGNEGCKIQMHFHFMIVSKLAQFSISAELIGIKNAAVLFCTGVEKGKLIISCYHLPANFQSVMVIIPVENLFPDEGKLLYNPNFEKTGAETKTATK